MRKLFGKRNHLLIGAITIVGLVAGVLIAFSADDIPLFGGGGTDYVAEFAESAGLKADGEVRIAGVKVGKVTSVSLDGAKVRVGLRVRDAWVGDRSKVSIEIKTLLGEKYLAIEPAGTAEQNPDETIPLSRTRSPFDVTDAIGQLSANVQQLDTGRLGQSFQVIADTLKNTPPDLRGALDGLSGLSKTISSRDEQLSTLLANTSQVSKIAADRDTQVTKLISDGNQLLGELQRRKQAVDALLSGSRTLAAQLHGLVADNQAQLNPALVQLDKVTGLLQRNQDNLSQGLRQMAPFVRVFTNTLGNGRWFDGYLCGLIPPTSLGVPIGLSPEGCPPPNPNPTPAGGGR
jgi:phospholipid/cholesterol/gamma-HCH transport system substrate-binding protein